MDFFRRLGQQLREVWAGMSSVARILFVVIGIGVIVALVIFFYPRSSSQWGTLYSNLSTEEAQSIADKLQTQGVAVRLSSDGRTVEVPPDRVGALRIDLASQGLPATAKGYELFDQVSLGTTPFTDQIKLLRAKQAVIANSIQQLEGVQRATVEIARPDPSPFIRDAKPTTASVLVQMKPGASLNKTQVHGIVAFVTKAVEGLTPENVSVVDGKGQLLSEASGSDLAVVGGQLDAVKALEAHLSSQAESMLAKTFGPNRVVVKVHANMDFKKRKEIQDTVNPEAKTSTKEKTVTTKTSSSGVGARGVAGAQSNLATRQPGAGIAGGGSNSLSSTDENDTEYAVSKTHSELDDQLGSLSRLTIAAIVDLTPGDGDSAAQPGLNREAVENLIKQAVGFDSTRGDTIQVSVAKLASAKVEEPPPPTPTETPSTLPPWLNQSNLRVVTVSVSAGALAVAALMLVIMGWLLLRPVRPAPAPTTVTTTPSTATAPVERERVVERLTTIAERDPDALARALAALMDQP